MYTCMYISHVRVRLYVFVEVHVGKVYKTRFVDWTGFFVTQRNSKELKRGLKRVDNKRIINRECLFV